jgi:predicted nucleic acid-binding protein
MEAMDIIAKLPFVFICPSQVEAEIAAGLAQGHSVIAPSWLKVMALAAPLSPLILAALDEGEASVIQLALEQGIPRVCIDEIKGRRAAVATGLSVLGSLGLMGRAKALGLIAEARPFIEKAMREGIHYREDLVHGVLNALGE